MAMMTARVPAANIDKAAAAVEAASDRASEGCNDKHTLSATKEGAVCSDFLALK